MNNFSKQVCKYITILNGSSAIVRILSVETVDIYDDLSYTTLICYEKYIEEKYKL